MNIFFLHRNLRKCVRYYIDQHTYKMILETCQLLCCAIWMTTPENPPPYKKTHWNHPAAIWARASKENWLWLQKLGLTICKEYTYRYDKIHKTEAIIASLKCPNLPDKKFTDPPQMMPDEYKHEDVITAYRNFYILGKSHLHFHKSRHAWKRRKIPSFILKAFPKYANM